MNQTSLPKWQQLLAHGFGGVAQAMLGVLALVAVMMIGSALSSWADSHPLGPRFFGAPAPLLAYRVPPDLPTVPPCAGALCGLAAVVPAVQSLPTGAGFVSARAQLVLPPPTLVQAPEGGYLQAVGVVDERKPVVQRPARLNTLDHDPESSGPIVMALAHRGGEAKPVVVQDEGFVTAWSLIDADSQQADVMWTPPPKNANADSTDSAKARRVQWNQLKFRSLQFQPVPRLVGLRLASTEQTRAITVGSIAVLAWGDGRPALTPYTDQIVPSNGVAGVVRAVTSVDPAVELQVEVPRSSAYGEGHWLWLRMNGMPGHEAVLPTQIYADFFVPDIPEAEKMTLGQDRYTASRIATAYSKLPRESMRVVPSTAADTACAQPAAPHHACVWAEIAGVAVPVQVSVVDRGARRVGIRERGVFAGKSIAPDHWASLPVQVRRALSGGDTASAALARPALGAKTPIVLNPLPATAVGQSVGTRVSNPQSP